MIVTRGMGRGPQMLVTRGYGWVRVIVEVVSALVETGGGRVRWPVDRARRPVVRLRSLLAPKVLLKSPVRLCQAMKSLVANKLSLKSAVKRSAQVSSKVERSKVAELDSRIE